MITSENILKYFLSRLPRAQLGFVLLTEMPRKLMVFVASSDLLVFSVKLSFIQMKT